MREIVKTDQAPDDIGPFSQAIRANGFLFVSGQIPMDPKTRELSRGGLIEQAELVLRNLAAVLEAGGSSLDSVVKVGVFLKDMSEFARFNDVYARFFPEPRPARTTVEAARLPKDILVEIDAIALVGPR
ncbi:MAG TPA: RidA family protein [Thermoanaerobaculia bacterium]|jgi:2-iminobutanoate/2-iminopropanoate deaminase|nr:RidA family protein [Thermoanaerobaculia bacterium]